MQLKWLVRQTCCCNAGNTGGSGRKISRDLTVNIDHTWSADVNEVYCKQRPFLSNRPTSSTKTRLTGPRFVTQHTINMGCLKHAPSPDKPPRKPPDPQEVTDQLTYHRTPWLTSCLDSTAPWHVVIVAANEDFATMDDNQQLASGVCALYAPEWP